MRLGKTRYILAAAMLATVASGVRAQEGEAPWEQDAVIASGLRAQGAEAPSSGKVMSTEGSEVISYHCEQTAPSKMGCDFKRVTIKANLEEADRPAALANIKEQFANEEDVSSLRDWACNLRDKLGDEGVSPEELHALIPMHLSEGAAADAQAFVGGIEQLCTDHSNAPLDYFAPHFPSKALISLS